MSQKDTQPHDKFFRDAFSRIDIAKDYLQHFLPLAISKNLDLSSLELQSESYISPALQDYYSDKVYTCQYKDKTKITITFLLEHKSYPPTYPHFQLLRYQLEIWEHQLKNKQQLTPVLPVIIYHGDKKWTYKPLSSYFKGIDEPLKAFLPDFKYHLTDLSHYTDEQLLSLKMGFLLNTFLALKHYKEEAYIRQQFGLLLKLEREDVNGNFTQALLVYLYRITEIQPPELNQLIKQVESHQITMIMSTYDMLIAEGKKRAEVEKIKEGIKKGIETEKILSIRSAFRKRLAINTIAIILNVSTDYVKNVKQALKNEDKILQLLKDKLSIKRIAQQLKISELVVEAIKKFKTKK